MEQWYVNHIPTYQTDVRREKATEPAKNYYDTYKDATVAVIDGITINIPDGKKATKKISDKKLGYYYPPFSSFETTYGNDRNLYKRYIGDDCTGFAQAVIYTLSNGDRGQTGDVNTATDGLYTHNTSAINLVMNYYGTDKAMLNLGWEKYYLDGSIWKQKRLYNGEVQIRTLKDAFGYEMNDAGVNFLEPGDLLCTRGTSGTDGHVEFYVGYNYEVDYFDKYNDIGEIIKQTVEEKKENGIESIAIGDEATQGHSTFGWGGVHDTFPVETNHFKFSNNCFNRYIIVISNGNEVAVGDKDSNGNAQRYTVIWRKN